MSDANASGDGGELRPYVPPDNLQIASGPGRPVELTFDPRTPEGAKLLIQATLGELPRLDTLAGKVVEVAHWFQHDAASSEEYGAEGEMFRRTVIFLADGSAYSCGSQGVDKAVHIITLMIGPAPWKPGVRCEVKVSKTRKGHNWMVLYPDMDALAKRMSKPRRGA